MLTATTVVAERCQPMSVPSKQDFADLERELAATTAELAQSRTYQGAISEILRVISESGGELQPVLDAIAERAMTLCGANVGAVVRFDGHAMSLGAVHGIAPRWQAAMQAFTSFAPRGDFPAGRAILERVPVQCADILDDPEFVPSEPVRGARLRGVLAVPLLKGHQCAGSIVVFRSDPGLFEDPIVTLFQTFADQAVIAIENARLFSETQEALERQTATAEILKVISGSPTDVQPVFDAIAERAVALCGATAGNLVLVQEGQAHILALHGVSSEIVDAMRAAFPRDIDRGFVVTRAILDGAPVRVADYLEDPDLSPAVKDITRLGGPISGLAVPLRKDDVVIGAIFVSRSEPGLFPDKAVTLLETFADQAVIAIENVRLFNETRDALARQTATSEVLRVISRSPTDAQPVFDVIAERARVLCDGSMSGVMWVRGDQVDLAAANFFDTQLEDEARATFPRLLDRSAAGTRAILDGAPVTMDSYLEDPEVAIELKGAFGKHSRDLSALAVPIWRDGQAVGAIFILRVSGAKFEQDSITLLETFADQASIAVENARLFNETSEALAQQTAISDILRITTESPSDAQPTLAALAEHAARLCDAGSASIFLIEDEHLRHVASRGPAAGPEQTLEPFVIDRNSTSGCAILERRTVQVDDILAEAETYPLGFELAQRLGFRSVVVAPLLRGGKPFGTILLRRQEVRPFNARDVFLLRTFGDQAAIALESVRLFNETREALEQQTATAEVLKVISSSVEDTAPVFDKILESCQRLFATEELGIFIADDHEMLHLKSYRGRWMETVRNVFPRPLHESIAGTAIRERRTVYIPDTQTAPELSPALAAVVAGVGHLSIIMAPMVRENRGIGTIFAVHVPPRPFSEKDIALLTTFADQAVIAIENSRLFHEIEDKSRQLEVADKHKSEFLANMSHELRTPLNAVIGFSEVLLERMFGELNEKQDDYLKDIHSSGKHLLSLINDILDLSKIEAGRMELDIEEFDARAALDNTLTLIRERAQRHGIALSLETRNELGQFRADQRKLKQIMLNLLSNAVKFTPDGGRIDVHARIDGDVLEVAISDSGIGIAESEQEAIFTEFRQAGGHYTNKQEGTGLGLPLTRRFVELHGGELRVTSVPGQGSTFTFTLPRQP